MIPRHPFTTLFLDIGGVLLTNGWDQGARRRAAEEFHLDYEELNERHHLTFDTFEEGKLSLEEYLNRVVFHTERSFARDEFMEFVYSQSKPFPDMIDLVCGLKERYHLQVAAVSNEGRELNTYRVEKYRLREFIDFFIVSSFIHIRKPDEDIYRIALDVSQVRPDQVVYIDDRAMFIEVAQTLGIKGIVHTDHATTQKALEDLGMALDGGM
jgi:putative hydrolase of the HAD superfamily